MNTQDTVYEWVKEHVASLPRNEGVFITEAQVAEATNSSRTPAREALLRLEAEGLIQIVPKKGAFVPPISDAEVLAVMEARVLIEERSIRHAAGYVDRLADHLGALVNEQLALLSDPVAFIEHDRDFHRAIVTAAGNPVLTDFYESIRDRQVRMGLRAIAGTENRAQTVVDEHATIVAALRGENPIENAAKALTAHLDVTLQALRLPEPPTWSLDRREQNS
jgi:DNA-binding GntR family transcriptional regulator